MRNVAAVALSALVLAVPASAEMVNGINAIVHDAIVTYAEVQILTQPVLRSAYKQGASIESLRQNQARLEKENLDELVQRQLILHDFKESGFNLPESLLDDLVEDEIRSRYKDRRTWARDMQAKGMTVEKFRNRLREQYIVSAMRQKNISSEIIISPHKMEKYYEANREQFKVEDEVKLRMIELPRTPDGPDAKKMAEEILQKLKEGVPFEDFVAIHSQRRKNSEWIGKSVLRTELAQAVLQLKPGEQSGIVETSDTCYILKLEELRAEHYKPLTEVRNQIEQNLRAEEVNRLEKQWVERLKRKTFVRYH